MKYSIITGSMLACLASGATAQSQSPNIVFILADDMGWTSLSECMDKNLSSSRSDFHRTPNIDRLIRQGVRFSNGYAACPVSSPTRYSLQTGINPSHLNHVKVGQNTSHIDHSVLFSIPKMLKSANPDYACAHFGKWHLDCDPSEMGYEKSDGLTKNLEGDVKILRQVRYTGTPPTPMDRWLDLNISEDPKLAESLTDKSIEFIERCVADKRPFYLQLSHYALHKEIICSQSSYDMFDSLPRGQYHNHVPYAAMLYDMDLAIGRLMDKLDEIGLRDNTYIMFITDNGGVPFIPPTSPDKELNNGMGMNSPLQRGKWDVYEGGLRVPFVMAGPGIEADIQCDKPVITYDWLPTVARIVGYKEPLPTDIDGRSFLSLAQGKKDKASERALFFHYPNASHVNVGHPAQAIRRGDWKLIRYTDTGETMLFNLRSDLSELYDLSAAEPARTLKLRGELEAYMAMHKPLDWDKPTPHKDKPAPAKEKPASKTAGDLWQKEAFDDRFPKKFVFRSEPFVNREGFEYAAFESSGVFSAGFIQKYVNVDEVPKIIPGLTAGFATKYVKKHPEKLVLEHWDAQEHVNDIRGSSDRYFPGHWCIYEGTVLSEPLTEEAGSIHVKNVKPLTYPINSPKARSKWLTPTCVVIELDEQGNPRWDRYEYVEIKEADPETGTITVSRGMALSQPRPFPAGSRVAPISSYLGTNYLFAYNYATNAPRDKNGKTGIDIQLEEIQEFFDPKKGVLKDLDGIGFDVLNWEPHAFRERVDSDGDGVADGGYDPVTGEDLWRRGAYEFQKRLREKFGPDFVMINDGYSDTDQRALGLFNGIESEGLVRHNDAFRGFSKTLNVFGYWADNNPVKYKLSYFVPKIMNPTDIPRANQLRRLCMATATCLGAGINLPPVRTPGDTDDEICAGKAQKAYWLGRPVEKMQNHALEGRDILKGAGKKMDSRFLARWSIGGCTARPSGSEVSFSGLDKDKYRDNAVLTLRGLEIPTDVNDITVSFEIRAAEGLLGYDPVIPRMIRCRAAGLPAYEKTDQLNRMYNDMWGFFGTGGYTAVTFYYRNVAGLTLDLELTAEGQGDFSIRNFRVHAAPESLSRRFENGIVLVNPSLDDHTFDLQALGGGDSFRRIDGKGAPNDGTLAGDRITLGPLEGLFLVKNPAEKTGKTGKTKKRR